LKVADRLAHVSQRRNIDLGKNIAGLKFKLKKKTGEQATEIKKSKRRRTFSASENGATRCPWCWILDGNNNGSLEPVGNSSVLRCSTCNHSLVLGDIALRPGLPPQRNVPRVLGDFRSPARSVLRHPFPILIREAHQGNADISRTSSISALSSGRQFFGPIGGIADRRRPHSPQALRGRLRALDESQQFQPRREFRSREHLTETEVEKLIEAAKDNRYGHRDATMILVAYRHGLRASEVCDLRWEQFDFNSATLHVRRLPAPVPEGAVLLTYPPVSNPNRSYKKHSTSRL